VATHRYHLLQNNGFKANFRWEDCKRKAPLGAYSVVQNSRLWDKESMPSKLMRGGSLLLVVSTSRQASLPDY